MWHIQKGKQGKINKVVKTANIAKIIGKSGNVSIQVKWSGVTWQQSTKHFMAFVSLGRPDFVTYWILDPHQEADLEVFHNDGHKNSDTR